MDSKSSKHQTLNSDMLCEESVSNKSNDLPKCSVEAAARVWDSFFLNSEGASSDFLNDRLPDDE